MFNFWRFPQHTRTRQLVGLSFHRRVVEVGSTRSALSAVFQSDCFRVTIFVFFSKGRWESLARWIPEDYNQLLLRSFDVAQTLVMLFKDIGGERCTQTVQILLHSQYY